MTDTGQVPGEGLPENAGMVEQPGIPAPGAYTFLDPSEHTTEDDDLLLMPGAQGAWSEHPPGVAPAPPVAVPPPPAAPVVPNQAAPQQQGLPQAAVPHPAAPEAQIPMGDPLNDPLTAPLDSVALGDVLTAPQNQTPPQGVPLAGTPAHGVPVEQFAGTPAHGVPAAPPVGTPPHGVPYAGTPAHGVPVEQYAGTPAHGVPVAPQEPVHTDHGYEPGILDTGAHEAAGRDSGSVDLGGVRAPAPPAAPAPQAARRPLHMGPAVPEATGGVVLSLADRGPAAVPAPAPQPAPVSVHESLVATGPAPVPVRNPGPPTTGPEYLDMPQDQHLAPQGAEPWAAQPQEAVAPQAPASPAETVVPQSGQFVQVEGNVPTTPHLAPIPQAERTQAAEPVPAAEPAEVPEAPVAVAETAAAPAEALAAPAETVEPQATEPQATETQAPETQATVPAPREAEPAAEAPEPATAEPEAAAAPEPEQAPEAEEQAPVAAETPAEPVAVAEPPLEEQTPEEAAPEAVPEEAAPEEVPVEAYAHEVPFVPEEEAPEALPEPTPEVEAEAAVTEQQPPADEAPLPEPAETLPQPVEAVDAAEDVEPEAAAEAAPAPTPAEQSEQSDQSEQSADTETDTDEAEAEAAEVDRAAVESAPAPGYADAEREAVLRVMRERRDIRNGFRSDPIPHEVLLRVLEAAHTAPSVGHSQPWDFVVIRSAETRQTMHELAQRQREAYAKSLPKARAKQFKELKIEAILDTPVNIVVTADPTRGGRHTLGRYTQPQMAPYSSALAVENLWLAARAEGLGVGWVSFFDEREMVRTLGLPEHLEVVAYLCVGYVDEFPEEPELMQAGWSKRRPLSWVVHEETYGRRALPGEEPHDLLQETVANIRPLDAKALGEAWERQKRMTKPAGALGMLEIISAQLSGLSRMCPPPIPEPAAVAIFAGDHGVHAQGVTPWPQEVTGQMVANFLGGGAVCNAFANQVGAEVCVIDVGVASELPATPGLLPRKVRPGTGDFTTGLAMTREEVLAAIEVGIETARDLVAAGNKALLTGEMGIANTTASAALISVYTGVDPTEVTGRGTGINDETHARKVDVVRRALALHQPDPADPIGVLSAVGGLEHAALVGLILGAASLRTPVILDGVSTGAAALVARAIAPESLAACIAGHRSAEPGHVAALNKLGLRPLVDLDLRLGEGTGALLALPLVQSAARVMHEVATFDSAGVTEK
ncbi:nicotinate-nucleotide--dimethylbenzimidazole phosphoribosyltransferase [Streptomyces exfoliatus]|uniref:nicotinate-nucleotide--dimethylbenzimidazole phosphoribosyltransferase n=1 Tax=Streptomyces exfoliatus TaxID=1905 RepID=UPI0037A35E0B